MASVPKAQSAGRGLLWITFAKGYFIVTAYGVQLLLPRLFHTPEEFGFYRSAMSLVSILNNVLIAATVQTVSKHVSDDESRAPETLRQALLLQLVWGGVLSATLVTLAVPIARLAFASESYAPLLRISAAVVLAYALYGAIVGYINGTRRFSVQARLDVTFSTLRSTGLVLAPLLGFGVLGSFTGFAIAAVSILVIAAGVAGVGRTGARSPWRGWITFMAPLWAYQLCLNFVLQVDVALLTRTATILSREAGLAQAAAEDVAKGLAGLYGAAQTFAFVPYQLILSVTFVVFPLVAKATASGDAEMTRLYVRRAMRFSLLVLLAAAAPMAGAAEGVLRIAYPVAYVEAADALRVLSLGLVPFALFVIAATIVSGMGRPLAAAIIAGVSFLTVVVAVRLLVGLTGPTHAALAATACGTSAGALVALVATGVLLYRGSGAFLPVASAVRGLLAAGAGFGAAWVVPHASRIMALVALTAGLAAYLATLLLLREITKDEIATIRGAIAKRLGRSP